VELETTLQTKRAAINRLQCIDQMLSAAELVEEWDNFHLLSWRME